MGETYDLAIVGAGLAGLTAGLYGARYGLKTLIVEQMAAGGQVLNVEKIETFPGFPQGIAGFDLGPLVQEQAEAAGASFAMDTATGLEARADGTFSLLCEGDAFESRAIIVANGSAFRTLGIPGEADYVGKGVYHCASCDAPFFVGKDVCVVGGGDSALDEAAVLAQQVGRVLLVHRGAAFRAQQAIVDKVTSLGNVETRFQTEVVRINGAGTVESVTLRTNASEADEPIAGVFVFVGLEPNTAWLQGTLDLDPAGHVVTDLWLRTSVPGVFAAGDIRQHSAAQLASAAGDGATAAIAACRYLKAQ